MTDATRALWASATACEVVRDNAVQALLHKTSSHPVVHLLGSGKTTLLQQVHAHLPQSSIFINVSGGRRCGHSAESMTADFCGQAAHLLWPVSAQPPNMEAHELVQHMLRRAGGRRAGEKIVVIIDGLESAPVDDPALVAAAEGLVPWGALGIRIISTHPPPQFVKSVQFELFGLSHPEASELLKQFNLPESDVKRLNQEAAGDPQQLHAASEVLRSGGEVGDALDALRTNDKPAAVRWKAAALSRASEEILSIMALTLDQLSCGDIAAISEMSIDSVRTACGACSIVTLSEDRPGFASPGLARHAREVLVGLAQRTYSQLADYFISTERRSNVGFYLRGAGREKDLLDTSTPLEFERLAASADRHAVVTRADQAAESARKNREHLTLVGFEALAASQGNPSTGLSVARELVPFLHVLGRDVVTERLIGRLRRPERRIVLLAALSAARRRAGDSIPAEDISVVESLLGQVDLNSMRGQLPELLSDLLSVDARLASEFLARWEALGFGASDDTEIDWQLASTVATSRMRDDQGAPPDELISRMRDHIVDPRAKYFADAAWRIMRGDSAADALSDEQTMGTDEDRVLFLRHWIMVYPRATDAVDVASRCLDLAVRATAVSITPQMLSDLSLPLAVKSSAHPNADALARSISAHLGPAGEDSPSVAAVRARSNIAVYSLRQGQQNASSHVVDMLHQMERSPSADDALATIAHLYGVLHPDPADVADVGQFRQLVSQSMEICLQQLLSTAALAGEAVAPLVEHLFFVDPDAAARVVRSLPIPRHRTSSVDGLVKKLSRAAVPRDSIPPLLQICSVLPYSKQGQDAIWSFLHAVWSLPDSMIDGSVQTAASWFIRYGQEHHDPLVLAVAHALSARTRLVGGVMSNGEEVANCTDAISKIDGYENRIMTIARVGAVLGRDPAWRQAMITLASDELSGGRVARAERRHAAWLSLMLAVRTAAYSWPLSETQFARLSTIATTQSSRVEQLLAFGTLAAAAHWRGDRAAAESIVHRHILPPVKWLAANDVRALWKCAASAAMGCWLTRRNTTLEWVNQLPDDMRDYVWQVVAGGLCDRGPVFHIITEAAQFSYEDALDVMETISHIRSDWRIYSSVRTLANRIDRANLSREQRVAVADKIGSLASTRLPDPTGHLHDGYKILVSACARSIDRNRQDQVWTDLFDAATRVRPYGDACLVLTELAEMAPPAKFRERMLSSAFSMAGQLRIAVDRRSRFKILGKAAHGTSIARSAWMNLFQSSQDAESYSSGDVDLSFDELARIDPTLADSLVSRIDVDRARVAARLRHRKKVADSMRDLEVDGERVADDIDRDLLVDLVEQRHDLLLQRKPVVPLGREGCVEILRIARQCSPRKHYVLSAYVVDSLSSGYPHQSHQIGWRSLTDLLLVTTDISRSINSESDGADDVFVEATQHGEPVGTIYSGGDADAAHRNISEWITRNCRRRIVVVDPYFSLSDVRELAAEIVAGRSTNILAGPTLWDELTRLGADVEETLAAEWAALTAVGSSLRVVVPLASGASPLHDRWRIGDEVGLRVGTSPSGYGKKVFEVSTMNRADVRAAMGVCGPMFDALPIDHNGTSLRYKTAIVNSRA